MVDNLPKRRFLEGVKMFRTSKVIIYTAFLSVPLLAFANEEKSTTNVFAEALKNNQLSSRTLSWNPMEVTIEDSGIENESCWFRVKISIKAKVPAAPVLRVELPSNSGLKEGNLEETFAPSPYPYTYIRFFRVAYSDKQTDKPVRFTLTSSSRDSSFKTWADFPAVFPDISVKKIAQESTGESIPPVRFGNLIVDRAIPLSAKEK